MSKPTHYILNRNSKEKIFMYNVNTHSVYTLNGKHYTNMSLDFTNRCLEDKQGSYIFKKIITQLENK